jgi:UDP-N-acetylmuramoyl-tripeptide--D-alanyl-D-alanine ligase
MKITLNQLTKYLALSNPADDQTEPLAISIDTRNINPENPAIYFAIKGAQFDGHDFIDQAAINGAEVFVVKKDYSVGKRKGIFLFVEDTEKAFGQVAAGVRKDSPIPWVGITGSAGKTTTRRFISDLLSVRGPVLETVSNNNNQIGVPLTIFNLVEKHRYAVVEAGTNHFGEIEYLANILKPDIAVITNIGPTHIEFLESIEGVAKEKGALFKHLKPDGKAILNCETRCVDYLKEVAGKRLITYGLKSGDVTTAKISIKENSSLVEVEGHVLEIPFKGDHYVSNFLAAVAVARSLNFSWEEIAKGAKNIQTVHGRLDLLLEEPVHLIDDSYNASFDSMLAAFNVLKNLPQGKRKIAVLGDMRELGPKSIHYHQELVKVLNTCGFDLVMIAGDNWHQVISQYTGAYVKSQNLEELISMCQKNIKKSDQILVKASRSLRFDLVAKSIYEHWKGK